VLPGGNGSHELLAEIDHVAEVIAHGTLRQQKELMNALFDRVEQRNGQVERCVVQSWARELLWGTQQRY